MAKPKVLPYGKMEHFSIIFYIIRARTCIREGTTKFMINSAIWAKINVVAWEFRGCNFFVKCPQQRDEGPVDLPRKILDF